MDYEGLNLLLEATRALRRTREDFHVLVIGDGAQLESLRATRRGARISGTSSPSLGRVPHEEVERYYSIIDITPVPAPAAAGVRDGLAAQTLRGDGDGQGRGRV